MSTSRSIADSAVLQAEMIRSQVSIIALNLPENEQFQIRKRMLDTVYDLENSVCTGFTLKSKIERVRLFVNIVGKLMECKDYLDYVNKLSETEINDVNKGIDELSNLLLVNRGTLN